MFELYIAHSDVNKNAVVIGRLLNKAEAVGKVVTQFIANHPKISKRQTVIKIGQIAVKEKRGNDAKMVSE